MLRGGPVGRVAVRLLRAPAQDDVCTSCQQRTPSIIRIIGK
jgi:hypothetical protein